MKRERTTGPRQNVKHALFALSGNQCAFPDCDAPMLEETTIVGEISHIYAQRPGGPRYKEGLGEEELHAIENLILLCPKHHKIVDEHPEQYDAAWLRRIKADHESRVDTTPSHVLHRLIDVLAPEVPDNWWERPSAPIFRLHLASSRPPEGQWTFQIELEQLDGGDIGRLRFAYSLAGSTLDFKAPTVLKKRKWRLAPLTFKSQGQPFELHLRFWWDGAERPVTHCWKMEADFQNVEPILRHS